MTAKPDLFQKVLKIRREWPVPPELLWHYLSTASGLACWQADDVRGNLTSGEFSLRWPVLGARLDLSVAEVQEKERLCLRAGRAMIELAIDAGGLSLLHHGLEEGDDFQGITSSWHAALGLLEVATSSHPRLPRTVEWLFERVDGSAELMHHFFTDRDALGSWLGESEQTLSSPASYSLQLFGHERLTGTVLYSGRDVCLKVHQLSDGALSLRTLPGPNGTRLVAFAVSTWNGPVPDSLLSTLKGALRRLKLLCQQKHS